MSHATNRHPARPATGRLRRRQAGRNADAPVDGQARPRNAIARQPLPTAPATLIFAVLTARRARQMPVRRGRPDLRR